MSGLVEIVGLRLRPHLYMYVRVYILQFLYFSSFSSSSRPLDIFLKLLHVNDFKTDIKTIRHFTLFAAINLAPDL